jgi:hypothetical protein
MFKAVTIKLPAMVYVHRVKTRKALTAGMLIFQRDFQYASIGVEHADEIQQQALPLLGCAGNGTLNGRLIFGALDTDLIDNRRYYYCIGKVSADRDRE